MAEIENNTVIIVLGMHRSGTSALTRLINMLGVDLGNNLLEGIEDINTSGFWEHQEIVALNERILSELGSRWYDHRHLPESWWKNEQFEAYLQDGIAIIKSDFKHHQRIGLKDPRLCRLLPFWLKLFKKMEKNVKCILILRNPQEVANSLNRRDAFDPIFSYYLWLTYVLEAEYYSRHVIRSVIHYDDLLSDWEKTVLKLAEDLSLEFKYPAASIEKDVNQELRPDYKHQKATLQEFQNNKEIPNLVKAAYRVFFDAPIGEIPGLLNRVREKWDSALSGEYADFHNIIFSTMRNKSEQAVKLNEIGQMHTYALNVIKGKDESLQTLNGLYQTAVSNINEKDHIIDEKNSAIEEITHRNAIIESQLQTLKQNLGRSLLECDLQQRKLQYIQGIPLSARRLSYFNTIDQSRLHYHVDLFDLSPTQLNIRGWIFSEHSDIESIQLRLTGKRKETFPVAINTQRQDVFDQFQHKNAIKSGFHISVSIAWSGRVKIDFVINLKNGLSETLFIKKAKFVNENGFFRNIFKKLIRVSRKDLAYAFGLLRHGNFRAILNAVRNRFSIPREAKGENLKSVLQHFSPMPSVLPCHSRAPIDIIVPVFNGKSYLPKLFDNIFKNTKIPFRLIIIDDCSTDETVYPFLEAQKAKSPVDVILLKNSENIGFVKTVNQGYIHTRNHFVILNTDIELPPNWLIRLMRPILNNHTIASTTPFTNSGTICSFPNFLEDNPIFENLNVEALDQFFQRIHPDSLDITIPTGIGFCMGFNKQITEQIGFFDTERYGKGYGEENDWCMRASHKGYRNVMVPNLFVYHKHGGSFTTSEKNKLLNTNLNLLLQRYPDYQQHVDNFIQADILKSLRDVLKLLITAAVRKYGLILIIDHDLGGGANIYRNKLIKSMRRKGQGVLLCTYNFYEDRFKLSYAYKHHAIDYAITSLDELEPLFGHINVDKIIINDLVSFPRVNDVLSCVLSWKQQYGFTTTLALHNYFFICPSYTLLNKNGRYCATFELSACGQCLPGHNGEFKVYVPDACDLSMTNWRSMWADFLNETDRIVVFSKFTAHILQTVYKTIDTDKVKVIPHKVDYINPVSLPDKSLKDDLVIGILGAINYEKGIQIIKRMGQLITAHNYPVKIVIIGKTSDYVKSAVVSITGEYAHADIPKLVLKHGVAVFFIPSIWPETFSYTTEEIMQMGLPLAVFNIGAPAERVQQYESGLVINEISAENALAKIMAWRKIPIE